MMIDCYVRFVKTDPAGHMPTQGTPGAAGWDLYAAKPMWLPPGSTRAVDLGIAVEVPPGWEMQVRSRSGLAAKHGVFVMNSPGTVDSDFRGTVKVILHNQGHEALQISPGDRVAQAVLAQVPTVKWVEVQELSETDRGGGGLGSTGIKTE